MSGLRHSPESLIHFNSFIVKYRISMQPRRDPGEELISNKSRRTDQPPDV